VRAEQPVVAGQAIAKDGPAFAGSPAHAQTIAQAGFHAVSLANNHIRDLGDAAVAVSLAVCRQAGLAYVGAGADRTEAFAPLLVDLPGLRLGILALTDPGDATATAGHGGAADISDPCLPLIMADARSRCDTLVVVAHGGIEYSPVPPPYWADRLTSLVALGADAVIAHHPHVPQGVNLVPRPGRGPAPICWSLGNFIFPGRAPDAQKPPLMALGFTAGLRLGRGQVQALDLTPYRIVNGQGLVPLDAAGIARCGRFVAGLGALLVDRKAYEAWWDQFVLRSWRIHACDRVRGLTARLCDGDPAGLRHGQSHFMAPAHYTLFGREAELRLAGTPEDPATQKRIEAWFAGAWPG
jgi:poly-gamma-glutamate synthesis protein (capsule biosynthesis protein)